jgi:hypothetical protein
MAAPNAYWLPGTRLTSALVAAAPSLSSFERCARHFDGAAASRHYDMDILNLEFGAEALRLPRDYFALNSEWEDGEGRYCLGGQDERFAACRLVHYTAVGKPWTHPPALVRQRRPRAHPCFHALWERWWTIRDDVARAIPPAAIERYARLRDYPYPLSRGSEDP